MGINSLKKSVNWHRQQTILILVNINIHTIWNDIRQEAIHVAAVALSIIEHLPEVERLTPAQENAYKGSPLDSKPNKIYGVVDAPENAVQPVFSYRR